jgi:hypothetical protein
MPLGHRLKASILGWSFSIRCGPSAKRTRRQQDRGHKSTDQQQNFSRNSINSTASGNLPTTINTATATAIPSMDIAEISDTNPFVERDLT